MCVCVCVRARVCVCVRTWHRVPFYCAWYAHTMNILACRFRPPRVPTWRRSRSIACTRTSTHGRPKTTRRVHTTCYLLAHTYCLEYLPTCYLLSRAHARTLACFTLTHKLKRTFLSRLPGAYVPRANVLTYLLTYLLTDALATRRVRSSHDCVMALSHLSATPPPLRRRAAYHLLTTAYYLSAQYLLLAAIAQATCSLTSTY